MAKTSDDLYVDLKSKLNQLKSTYNSYTGMSNDRFLSELLAEDVLLAAYTRNKHLRLTAEQIEELEHLVADCVDPLKEYIRHLWISFDMNQIPLYLELRSGIQFMIEDFESLKLKCEDTEASDFKPDFKPDLISFTEMLETWQRNNSSNDSYEVLGHTEEELRRPEGIPTDHTWWCSPHPNDMSIHNDAISV